MLYAQSGICELSFEDLRLQIHIPKSLQTAITNSSGKSNVGILGINIIFCI